MQSEPITLVEVRHDPPLDEARRQELFPRLDACLAARSLRWLGSFISVDGRLTICQFAGSDVDSAREAYETAGIPATRVYLAHTLLPPSD